MLLHQPEPYGVRQLDGARGGPVVASGGSRAQAGVLW
jgi:hypothetical protein